MLKNQKGFSLIELIVVVAIMAVLVSIVTPQFTSYVEKSREATDITNVGYAYSEIIVAATENSTSSSLYDAATDKYTKTIVLRQKQDGWQTTPPFTIGSVNSETDADVYWKNTPTQNGTCTISYNINQEKPVIDWQGTP